MPAIASRIVPQSETFQKNRAALLEQVEQLRSEIADNYSI